MDIYRVINVVMQYVFVSVYQYMFSSVILAFLFMFMYRSIKRVGVNKTILLWIKRFREDIEYRKVFFFAIVVSMILFRTVLCRASFGNPFSNFLGKWSLVNDNGEFYSDGVLNVILFIPYICLLFLLFREKVFKRGVTFLGVIARSVSIGFLTSLGIELTQAFLCLGKMQLTDLAWNTLGGLIGGVIFYIILKTKKQIGGK